MEGGPWVVEVDRQTVAEMDFGVSKAMGVVAVVVEMMEAEVVMEAVKLVKVEFRAEIQAAMEESHREKGPTRKRHLKPI